MADIIIEDFNTIDLNGGKALVEAQTGPSEAANWQFYNDDHWQDGDGYTGPRLSGSGADAKTVMAEIERQFTYTNIARELVDHHCDAVTAKTPQWGSVPVTPLAATEDGEQSPEQSARQGQLDDLLRVWSEDSMRGIYTDRDGITRTCDVTELLGRAARMYAATGRANLRPFIPPRRRDETGSLRPVPFEQSLRRVYFELLEPGAGAVYPDRERMEPISVTLYTRNQTEFAEFSYVVSEAVADAPIGQSPGINTETVKKTVLRQVSSEDKANSAPVILDLGGRLWLHEMSDDPILLGSILSQQKNANKALTMGDRNLDLAGFNERVLKNVQLDGYFVEDPLAEKGKRFVPYPLNFGAGSANNLIGKKIVDDNGKEQYLTPEYERIEPTGSGVFDDSADRGRTRMLDQSAQTYALMEGDGNASGVSRETARQRFRNSIGPTASALTGAGDWLFNIALCIARQTSNETTAFDELRVDFRCQLDLGALSALDRAEDRSQVEAGLMSPETAMTRGGIEDVDAENGRIADAPSLSVLQERATVMQSLVAAGVALDSAAQIVGFSEAHRQLLGVAPSPAPILVKQ